MLRGLRPTSGAATATEGEPYVRRRYLEIGERTVTLTLQAAGTALTGKMIAEDGNAVDIYEGKLAGNAASWKANIKNPMPLTLEFAGDVNGDRMSGTVNAAVGSWPFTGTKGA